MKISELVCVRMHYLPYHHILLYFVLYRPYLNAPICILAVPSTWYKYSEYHESSVTWYGTCTRNNSTRRVRESWYAYNYYEL